MVDNPLEDAEQIFAYVRVCRSMMFLFLVQFLRVMEASVRIPGLKFELWWTYLDVFRGMLDLVKELGDEGWTIVKKMVMEFFGLIERSEEV